MVIKSIIVVAAIVFAFLGSHHVSKNERPEE
jgi:hypothetical protein